MSKKSLSALIPVSLIAAVLFFVCLTDKFDILLEGGLIAKTIAAVIIIVVSIGTYKFIDGIMSGTDD